MPIHDWTKLDAGTFHFFHLRWLAAICDVLNEGGLPGDYYAMAEQVGAGYVPDVLALELRSGGAPTADAETVPPAEGGGGGMATTRLAPPRVSPTTEGFIDAYRRMQRSVVVRHVTGDRMVAVIEIVSPGNKSGAKPFDAFVEKAATLLLNGVHLVIVDLFPRGPRDPRGIHAAVWEDAVGECFEPEPTAPLSALSYEAAEPVRAYVQHMGVGDPIPETPLFLKPNACVYPPLDAAYQIAFSKMPLRWRQVLGQPG